MKFSCEKSLLLSAILTASRAAMTKSPIPLLEGLLMETDDESVKITGYDLKTGIVTNVSAEVDEVGGIVLNARLFGEIIRKMPGMHVTVSVNSGYVAKISSEMSDFEILGYPTSDYPELPSVEEQNTIEISEAVLKKMISQTNFAVSDNESRPIHTGALFETENGELTIVAVDGYRLALRREPLDNIDIAELSFVVPGAALTEVERIISGEDENVIIKLGSKHIMFMIRDTILISRRLEGDFLNYKNSLPQQAQYRFLVQKNDLIAAVERVSLIISDKLKSPVRCIFGDGLLKLNSASALGKANDECVIEGDGEDLEIGFNDRYLLEALKAAPANNIILELNSGVTPCIISPADELNNFIYMILPVRLKAYEG
ncbi:MAG: DNA polymerase III subunit beta [Oscillospiraceae bacterium]|jgi:DNA polymerase-3 subunit beta|nr:DNA polymerase III subunit beta [Oscillospiraceae bacterium]